MRYESADYDDSIDDDPDTPSQHRRIGGAGDGLDSTVDWPAPSDAPDKPLRSMDDEEWMRHVWGTDIDGRLVPEESGPDELRWVYALGGMTLLAAAVCVVCAILAWWWKL